MDWVWFANALQWSALGVPPGIAIGWTWRGLWDRRKKRLGESDA